jgi:uncharacterized coiled-coil DUF342 family protein
LASNEDLETQSIESLKAQLASFRKEMRPIKDELRTIREKAREFRYKRDDLNKEVKGLSNEIKERREVRDKLNEEVRLQKAIRQAIWEQVQELIQQIRSLTTDMPQSLTKKQSFLARREKELDWKLQTTPLSLTQERDIVQEIAEIEDELDSLRTHQKKRTEIDKIKQKIHTLRRDADEAHLKVQKIAEEAQAIHDGMIDHFQRIDESRKAADQFHANFIKELEQINALSSELDIIQEKYRKILTEVRKREKTETDQQKRIYKHRIDELRQKKVSDAEEKLKKGGKLTFDEFYLLQNSEINSDDEANVE